MSVPMAPDADPAAWVSPEDLARIIGRDMSGANAWHVQMDEEGELFWENDTER